MVGTSSDSINRLILPPEFAKKKTNPKHSASAAFGSWISNYWDQTRTLKEIDAEVVL